MSKVIFITGASKGFGKKWAEALLKRGDNVVATARNVKALDEMVQVYGDAVFPLELDITDRDACFAAIEKAKAHLGKIDVLINNAGFGVFGAIEETSEKQAKDLMDANFFGLLWLTQAVIPIMRAQHSGHIIQVSSYLGLVTLPLLAFIMPRSLRLRD
jgi:NADP-dependent 3-hydroxy acid dehydrogenase YdfG